MQDTSVQWFCDQSSMYFFIAIIHVMLLSVLSAFDFFGGFPIYFFHLKGPTGHVSIFSTSKKLKSQGHPTRI